MAPNDPLESRKAPPFEMDGASGYAYSLLAKGSRVPPHQSKSRTHEMVPKCCDKGKGPAEAGPWAQGVRGIGLFRSKAILGAGISSLTLISMQWDLKLVLSPYRVVPQS
jgi:hypothetical protein